MRSYLTLGAAISVLAGCAPFPYTEAPLATNFATTKQEKLQAAHHWQMIANGSADNLAAALAKSLPCVAPAGNCPRLFVDTASPASTFGKAFHSQFISRLVNNGLNVATQAPGDIVVTVEAQTVRFSPDRSQYMGAGKFTMLGTGIYALYQMTENSVQHAAGFGAMGVAIATDIYQWNMSEFAKGPTPQIELILTISATRGGQFLARATNVYYIADTDATLYCWSPEGCGLSRPPPPPPSIRVVGDCGPAPCVSTGTAVGGSTGK